MGRAQSDYEHVEALPLSTKDSGSLLNGGSRHAETFDVELDVEDDILLDWQKHGSQGSRSCNCCSRFIKLLPAHLQEPPDWWWRFSKTQRSLIYYGLISLSLLLLTLSILGIVYSIDHSSSSGSTLSIREGSVGAREAVRYQPQNLRLNSSPSCSWDSLYLPNIVQPSKYQLHIKTGMQEPYLVEGEVHIVLNVSQATPCIVLHSNGIDVQSIKLLLFNGDDGIEGPPAAEIEGRVKNVSQHHQQLILQFPEAVPPPPMQPVLVMTFSYTLQEALDGFYRSSFVDAANRTKVLASTQFESIAARKAFPCFDEPAYKATFEVKVTAPPPPIVVLSNMPLSHTHGGRKLHKGESHEHKNNSKPASEHGDELITYHFEPSPPMSTYLVAWVVGELAHVEMKCPLTLSAPETPWTKHQGTNNGDDAGDGDDDDDDDHRPKVDSGERGRHIPVRVWGTSDRASKFGHAKEVACYSLQTMEELLQVPYALPKLDLVAIPNFAAGAMENWGLLTYRETSLLVDDSMDDINQKYGVATTVAHETAHQWFGDLVTLDDWTELWLNEGFATYFEVVVADAFRPTWGYFNNFQESTTSPGLEADGLTTSHPLTITRPIKKLSEIDNWFDDVSYAKGGAVLRMLRAWLNRGNAPMLGFSSSSSDSTAGPQEPALDGLQHMRRLLHQQRRQNRRLQRLLSQHLDEHDGYGSSAANGVNWWTGKLHIGQSSNLPGVVGLSEQEKELLAQEIQLEQGAVAYETDVPRQQVPSADDASHNTGSGSSIEWWTKNSHFGAATADLQQQVKQAVADAGRSSVTIPAVLPAPSIGMQYLASNNAAKSGSDEPDESDDMDDDDDITANAMEGLVAGRDEFLLGLRSYLQDLSYQNSNYSTLWQHLEAASGQPVSRMMNTWTLRRGFPIVSMSLQPSAGGSKNQQLVQFDQVPYHAPRSYMVGLPFYPEMYCNDWTDDPQDDSWWIPVAMLTPGSNTVQWHSFSNCSSSVSIAVPHNGWVLANAGRYGFYRVNYTEPLWTALAAAAGHKSQISSIDFAGLLDDAYSLSLVRQLDLRVFLSLTKALGHRIAPEKAPWGTALGWLQRMTDVLSTAAYGSDGSKWKDCLADLKAYVTDELTRPFIAGVRLPGHKEPGLGFQVNPQDSPEVRQLRPQVLTAAGFLGHQQVMEQAAALLRQTASGQTALSPDVTKAVYSLAVGSGDSAAYDTVRKMYEEAVDPAAEERALRALARATTGPSITKTLEYALSPAVRSQDVSALLVGLAKQGGLGFNMTWEFILSRADDIQAKYGGGDLTYSLGGPLNTLAKLFVDEHLLDRLKPFAKQKPQMLSPTFLAEANEARMMNSDWLRFQGADACAWLSSSVSQGSSRG